MLTEATIERASLVPELLPDSQFNDISANTEVRPPLLDLRKFNKLLRLSDIAVLRDTDVEMRIRADKESHTADAGAMFDLTPNSFQVLSTELLRYNLYAVADKTDFRSSFGVWVCQLTVADKLKLGMSLTGNERNLAEKYGVEKSVEKGILPLPPEEQVKREYRSQLVRGGIETYGSTQSVGTSKTVVSSVYALPDEFIVLTGISATAGTAANNIRLYISRDRATDYLSDLKTYPIGLDRELPCFVPALDEIRIEAVSDEGAGVSVSVRYVIWRCRLTNLLRYRWGLISKDEIPGDTADKVDCGIL